MSVTREYKVKPRVLVIGLIIPIATALFGKIALERFELIQSGFSSYRLGLVQPNVPLHSTNGPNQEQAGYLTTPFRLTNNIAGSDPATDLIIWPEIPAAYSVTNQRYDYEWSKRFIDGIKMPILVSDFLYEQKEPDKPPIFYNTLHLLRPNNDPLLVYRKNILIPFGEYVPLADKLPFLDEIFPGVRRYTPGNESMPIRLQGKEISIAPAVCLEAIYPSHIAHFVRNGANVIVNPGNDGYFGKTSGAAVHLALSTFRAVEFGVPLLRVTNSGYSQVVLASGRQLLPNSTALFSESFWTVSVPIPRAGYATDPNLYTLLFCALICLAALILQLKR